MIEYNIGISLRILAPFWDWKKKKTFGGFNGFSPEKPWGGRNPSLSRRGEKPSLSENAS
jgi:hypothetical protein